jgi:hypothetical protein
MGHTSRGALLKLTSNFHTDASIPAIPIILIESRKAHITFFLAHKNALFLILYLLPEAYLGYGRQGTCHERHWQGAFGSFGYQHFRIDTFLFILTYVYISVY